MAGGNLAHKSSHALLFLQLKDADEKNIVNLNLGSTSASGTLEAANKSTGLSNSQETKSAQGAGYSAAG